MVKEKTRMVPVLNLVLIMETVVGKVVKEKLRMVIVLNRVQTAMALGLKKVKILQETVLKQIVMVTAHGTAKTNRQWVVVLNRAQTAMALG